MKAWTLLPPQWAHDLSPFFLPLIAKLHQGPTPEWQAFEWRGMHFKNRLGLAGGVDKNAQSLKAWQELGCGFAEVGTVTPEPQSANPGKILDRSLKLQALWNKMGFPSKGMNEVFRNLEQLNQYRRTPLFVNVGKNRTTANEVAHADYLKVMTKLNPFADAFVVNISSPNTAGLRELQKPESLQRLLTPLFALTEGKKPLLLKISPDMDDTHFQETLLISHELGVDGFVLTNTTLERTEQMSFPKEGGVSGAPLKERSLHALRIAVNTLRPLERKSLIVSCGGVMTPEDVSQRLHLGADLVEIYSALVFQGPGFFRKVAEHIHERN